MICAKCGAQLGEKDIRMVQGEPDTAPSQCGIGFIDFQIGQRFVSAGVQCAQVDWPRCDRLEYLSVKGDLFLFTGKSVIKHEWQLGAEQPNARRIDSSGERQLGGESGVGIQGNLHAIRRLRWKMLQRCQRLTEFALVIDKRTKRLAQSRLRLEVYLARIAVCYDLLPVQGGER